MDIAEKRGMMRFSQTPKHWTDVQNCDFLRLSELRQLANLEDISLGLFQLPSEICRKIYSLLEP